MKVFKFLIAAIITLLLVVLGSTHHPFDSPVPAIGKLLSPFDGFWQNAEQAVLPTQNDFHFPSLKEKVTVAFDERLVPHIFAQNIEDALFTQGYISAQYRLWQMDISVRSTAGYLAEVLGENLKNRDILKRRKGMRWAAENVVKTWKATGEIELIETYTRGVNAYIATLSPKDYPIEFKLMGYEPTPWTVLKTAIFLRGMAETLCSRNEDLRASNSLQLFGNELFTSIYPEHNPKQKHIIPEGTLFDFGIEKKDSTAIENTLGAHFPAKEIFESPSEFIGSNNWAVNGKKTKSGQPILCSDPHLSLSLPSIWFEIQISTPNFNAYGVSLPGIPGIAIGFNENIAWGETNAGHDVLDWYTIKWANKEKTKYLIDGQAQDIIIIEEEIKVRGAATIIEKVKYTTWGPIVHEENDSPYQDMAMQWLAHQNYATDNHSQVSTFLGLMEAKNYDDYSAALTWYDSPAQNFVFADNNGDIAIKVNGKFPIKKEQQGRFILDGSTSENAWKGFIPMDQVPQIRNPKQNYVTSANQRSAPKNYPYYYNGGFDDYRGRTLNRMLTRMEAITPQKMMRLQNNTFSIKAEEALPLMLKLLADNTYSGVPNKMLEALKSWDYRFEKDEKAPFLFEEWYRKIYRKTFDEIYSLRDSIDLLYPDSWRLIELLEMDNTHSIFDIKGTPSTETAENIVQLAFTEIAEELADNFVKEGYNWQQHKGTFIGHLGRIPGFSALDIPVGGYHSAINAVQGDFGPSWRMVVQLGEEPEAWGVFPGGQSGNPGSKYYDNMVLQWAQGEYNSLFFMKDASDSRQPVLFTMEFEVEGD